MIVSADMGVEAEVSAMFEAYFAKWPKLDVVCQRACTFMEETQFFFPLHQVVPNAGIQTPCPSHEVNVEDFDRVLNVNLKGITAMQNEPSM